MLVGINQGYFGWKLSSLNEFQRNQVIPEGIMVRNFAAFSWKLPKCIRRIKENY